MVKSDRTKKIGEERALYEWLCGLLSDKKGGEIFTCFGGWHLSYVLFTVVVSALVLILMIRKSDEKRLKAAGVFIDLSMGLYIADFFLMPFAYGEIDVEKLPFHICTAMCVMCFLSRHIRALEKYRVHFALLGFISNLVYLIYPAGVMWHAVAPLCYRVIQTLLFHSLMTVYGFLTVCFEAKRMSIRFCPRDLFVLVGMTAWALLGNYAYNGIGGRTINWFFVVADPFGVLDARVAPIVMPFLNIVLFFAAELAVYGIIHALRTLRNKERRPAREKHDRASS